MGFAGLNGGVASTFIGPKWVAPGAQLPASSRVLTWKYQVPSESTGLVALLASAGKFFTVPRFPGTQFMVMYNPAYLLRDPTKKTVTWEHLKSLRNYLHTRNLL